MTARFETRGLTGGYPHVTVFSDVNLSVAPGEILSILGANGSGKSALLETLQGLLRTIRGEILLDGEPVQELPPEVRAGRGICLVSDRRRLWKEMTVAEHLRVGAYRPAARMGWRRRALSLEELFPAIRSRRGARPEQLSGGLQQQLAIARFGMSSPGVWLLDDPLQGLDDAIGARVLGWIHEEAGRGAAVILTGQHVRALLAVATKGMFLEGGSLTEIPAGPEGLSDPRVRGLL
ncbi:MAG TPA: ATP-binding cassette domain-containing protein [Thermoanaerobaculia bacterium]|nr:ATP-binding cassette domain-containing protein [Thermoanaerobaculia bacterium]